MKNRKAIIVMVLIASAIFTLVGLRLVSKSWKFSQSAKRTVGMVKAYRYNGKTDDQSHISQYRITIKYATFSGDSIEASPSNNIDENTKTDWPVGTLVEIFFDPKEPTHIEFEKAPLLFPLIFLGMALLVPVVVIMRIRKSKNK